jgi:hypothetical protein
MKIGLLIIFIILGFVSCKPTDFVGRYELKHFPKTSTELKNDGTFEFIKITPNPYLHPFDHPEDNYFTTAGRWIVTDNQLILNSYKGPTVVQKPEIIKSRKVMTEIDSTMNIFGRLQPESFMTFTFYDIFGDTVNILYGQFPDSSSIARLHGSMRFLQWPTVQKEGDEAFHLRDTIEFHFYGYRPYQFIRTDRERRSVHVRLYPEKRGGLFDDKLFVIKRKRIKDGRIAFDKKRAP